MSRYERERIRLIVKEGPVMLAIALSAACSTEIQASPTEEIFPTQPRSTEVIPTPTPRDQIISGISQNNSEIRAAFGQAVGAGGSLSNPIEKVFNNSTIQGTLNRNSLAPVVDSQRGVTQISQFGDQRLCFPNMPEVLFNPNVPAGQDDWLEANGFITSYGDNVSQTVRFRGVGAVSLQYTEEEIICVNSVVNSDNNPYGERPGTVLNVIMDRNTGDIYGVMRGIYDANANLRFNASTGEVLVNNSSVWYQGNRMSELVGLIEQPYNTDWPSGWYRNASQEKMEEYTEFATRLYTVNNSGQREVVSLGRIDTSEYYAEIMGLHISYALLYGVVVDSPKLEQLPVTDYENNQSVLGVYTVPYMIQTKNGEYIIKEIIIGAESQEQIAYANIRANVLPERGPNRVAILDFQEAISRIEINKQYPFELNMWDNEEQEQLLLKENPGNEYAHDLLILHRSYHDETEEFINALLTGSGIGVFKDNRYLAHVGRITFNLDN